MTDLRGVVPRPWPEVQRVLGPLSATQREDLASSIAEHGVQYPVLVLSDGRIVDGHNRWEVSGGEAEVRVVDADEATAFALALALNLGRRHMTPEQALDVRRVLKENREVAKRVVAEMTRQGKTQQEIGDAIGYSQPWVSAVVAEQGLSNIRTDNAQGAAPTGGNARRRKIPLEDLEAIRERRSAGETMEEISRTYGVTDGAISYFLRKHPSGWSSAKASNGRRLLTFQQEEEIERRYRAGEGRDALALVYGCSLGTVRRSIHRVRNRYGMELPPLPQPESPPSNVVDFSSRAESKNPQTPVPKKPTFPPEVVQRHAVNWLKEARKLKDGLDHLESHFAESLASALATSEEGALMACELEAMAERFLAFAGVIRPSKDRQEERRHHVGTV